MMRSHISVVSSGYIEKLTLNGTFAKAAANCTPLGSACARLTPQRMPDADRARALRSIAAST